MFFVQMSKIIEISRHYMDIILGPFCKNGFLPIFPNFATFRGKLCFLEMFLKKFEKSREMTFLDLFKYILLYFGITSKKPFLPYFRKWKGCFFRLISKNPKLLTFRTKNCNILRTFWKIIFFVHISVNVNTSRKIRLS